MSHLTSCAIAYRQTYYSNLHCEYHLPKKIMREQWLSFHLHNTRAILPPFLAWMKFSGHWRGHVKVLVISYKVDKWLHSYFCTVSLYELSLVFTYTYITPSTNR